jgi:toxin CptA
MHAAPSVSYPVGRSRFAARLYAGLGMLGLAAAAAFCVQSAVFGWRQAMSLGAVAACGALAARSWRRSRQGVLHWNGMSWQWEEGATVDPGRPTIAVDLQSRMLLHWRAESGGGAWLWLEQVSAPADWAALRRAVYSRATPPAPAAAPPPPAAEQ